MLENFQNFGHFEMDLETLLLSVGGGGGNGPILYSPKTLFVDKRAGHTKNKYYRKWGSITPRVTVA